jgi:hypothetical protein
MYIMKSLGYKLPKVPKKTLIPGINGGSKGCPFDRGEGGTENICPALTLLLCGSFGMGNNGGYNISKYY